MSGNIPPISVPLASRWQHAPTRVYDKNYGCGINYYQPMIDYMNERENRSRGRGEYPHLPWTDGRVIWEDRAVEPYTNAQLVRHAVDAEAQAKRHLESFKVRENIDTKSFQTRQIDCKDRHTHTHTDYTKVQREKKTTRNLVTHFTDFFFLSFSLKKLILYRESYLSSSALADALSLLSSVVF